MSILDINPDALTHFSAAIAAEVARRGEGTALTRLQYDEVGATAGGFTPRQYFVLKARVRRFLPVLRPSTFLRAIRSFGASRLTRSRSCM